MRKNKTCLCTATTGLAFVLLLFFLPWVSVNKTLSIHITEQLLFPPNPFFFFFFTALFFCFDCRCTRRANLFNAECICRVSRVKQRMTVNGAFLKRQPGPSTYATAMTVGSLCQLNLFDNQRIIIKKGTTSHTVKHGFIMSQRERLKKSMSTKVKCLFLR